MTYETTLRKGQSGWRAETVMPLDFTVAGHPAELHLSTSKGNRGLTTYASVKMRDGMFLTMRFRDYHVVVYQTRSRCTEKAVSSQHYCAVRDANLHIAAAIAHHRIKGDVA